MKRSQALTGVFSLLASTACGAPDGALLDEGEIGQVEQGFGELTCGTGMANDELDIQDKSDWSQSPTSYGKANCVKTWTMQIKNHIPATAEGSLSWADPWNRTAVQCKKGTTSLQILSWTGNESIREDAEFTYPLYWDGVEGGCWYPRFEFRKSWNFSAVLVRYRLADGADYVWTPDIPGDGDEFELPRDLTGRSVRLAGQALTPSGNTQPIYVHMKGRGPAL